MNKSRARSVHTQTGGRHAAAVRPLHLNHAETCAETPAAHAVGGNELWEGDGWESPVSVTTKAAVHALLAERHLTLHLYGFRQSISTARSTCWPADLVSPV